MATPSKKCTLALFQDIIYANNCHYPSGRVIKELGLRRSDLVITTKLYFGTRKGPNDTGLSRKQCASLVLL